jgi:pyruvate/2-oxoglutarate dehydrogenase complex dihydrolipoamide dehydrogenase (E3) component
MVITLADGDEVAADRLLVATGRRVDLSTLGLEAVGLDGGVRFIDVDERMRVADGLWAIGDVTGKAMFTRVALYQWSIVAADILGRPHPAAQYDALAVLDTIADRIGRLRGRPRVRFGPTGCGGGSDGLRP